MSRGRLNMPDGLALFRVVMTVPIMSFVRADEIEGHYYIAAALFAVTALTDYLDGYLARRSTGGTVLGAFLDTTADKILVTGTLLALVSVDHVSVWPAAVIVFREFTVMALRGVVAQGGGLVKPSTWGKAKAVTQYLALFLAFLRLPEKWGPWYLDQYVMAIAVIATIGSMWGYLTAFWQVIRSEPAHADRT
ncbi:MAG: CDP-diacylglycerol--glycerol-3-phosphate 3-phosphatidyltransferase [Acidimicrobiales bacterium]|nr:CDP-diacylglycerol--glycerol-3-phosphate 3-phosphatidyltransferase [Acidimicrobiales bacterium]HLV89559.1 CDP-diacylglycerol--glycerol-3-phosphate 3-phosphatidyltransferase [Acidimicrobiia bacterium]